MPEKFEKQKVHVQFLSPNGTHVWKGGGCHMPKVALSVYELYWTSSVGKFVGKLLHVGIEVYWLEWLPA